MSVLNRVTVGRRQMALAIISALMLCACVAVGLAGTWQLARSSEKAFTAKDVVADILPPPMYLIEMRLVLSQAVEGTVTPDQAGAEIGRLSKEYLERAAFWQANPPFGLEASLLGDQHTQALAFVAAAGHLLSMLHAGDKAQAWKALGDADRLYKAHRAGVDATVVEGNRLAAASMAEFSAAALRSRQALLFILLLAIAAGGAVSWLLARSIVRPLQAAVELAEKVADGDLSARASVMGTDEAAQLQGALNHMSARLASVVGDVRDASAKVAVACRGLASSNEEMRQRILKQNAELHGAFDMLQEINSFVANNQAASDAAKQLAAEAGDSTTKGVDALTQLGETMDGVSRSSASVADMVGLIRSLAFQTHLLALNAAVEAARAGDQGRGFAVVAGEVRLLAARTTQAAEDIGRQVETTHASVAAGLGSTSKARAAMDDMAGVIRRMGSEVDGIWETNFAQTSGINLLVETMGVLTRDVEANSAMVTQTAEVSAGLEVAAGGLEVLVGRFRLGD